MIAVIFEVYPDPAQRQPYLDMAAEMRPLVEQIDGFISVERFQSLTDPDKLLSISMFRDEEALAEKITGQAGAIEVHAKDGRVFKGSHLLMAVGRKANMDKLNLDAAGIETHRTGITVDDSLKTTNKRVYAIGDVAGGLQFTHVAGYQAGVIIRSALFGLPAKQSTNHIPWATYTDPELAQVGLTEAGAREAHGDKVEVVRFDIHHNDRLIAERKA